jgi:CheY-like chemotaxis protein
MATILVVDDHVDSNEVLARAIRAAGHRVVTSYSGEGALAAIGIEKPDLVILDVMMPGMDGTEVLRVMRHNPSTATVPVILHSVVADPNFTEHALRKGANDFLIKGTFDLLQVNELIAKYLPAAA